MNENDTPTATPAAKKSKAMPADDASKTRRVEAATRLACAMLRHGHAAAEIPAKAVQFADLIIAEVDRTAAPAAAPVAAE